MDIREGGGGGGGGIDIGTGEVLSILRTDYVRLPTSKMAEYRTFTVSIFQVLIETEKFRAFRVRSY